MICRLLLPDGLKPMHERPHAGQSIVVIMRDGSQVPCIATRIYSQWGTGIVIYPKNKRDALDEDQARGWLPDHNAKNKGGHHGH